MSKSKSWNHKIAVIPDDALRRSRDQAERNEREGFTFRGRHDDYALCSSGRRCTNWARYVASYTYVTGRAGRTSHRGVQMCPKHAAKFCRKHGLELPDVRDLEEVLSIGTDILAAP